MMCAELLTCFMLWQIEDTGWVFGCWVAFETKTLMCLVPDFFPVLYWHSLLEWDDDVPVWIVVTM
jgi:hypothetical protein